MSERFVPPIDPATVRTTAQADYEVVRQIARDRGLSVASAGALVDAEVDRLTRNHVADMTADQAAQFRDGEPANEEGLRRSRASHHHCSWSYILCVCSRAMKGRWVETSVQNICHEVPAGYDCDRPRDCPGHSRVNDASRSLPRRRRHGEKQRRYFLLERRASPNRGRDTGHICLLLTANGYPV